jgi:hypothetical protein
MLPRTGVLPRPLVDFHVHLFPDKLFDAIWRQFVADYGWKVLHQLYWRESLAYLKERGVGTVVYSNYAHRKGIARGLNDWNLRVLAETPGLFCFAAYHPDDDDGFALAESLIENPRILGFKLQLLVSASRRRAALPPLRAGNGEAKTAPVPRGTGRWETSS